MVSAKRTTVFMVAAACLLPSCVAVRLYYSVSCPGQFNELRCPDGYQIVVGKDPETAGPVNNADCEHKDKRVLDTTCQEYAVPYYAALNCDGWNYCFLARPKADWLKCPAVSSFIQISYECQEQQLDLETVVACAGTIARLTCDQGSIKLLRYHYGRRDRTTCTTEPADISTCFDYTSDESLYEKCNNQKVCEILVGPDLSPVVCGEAPHYLELNFICHEPSVWL